MATRISVAMGTFLGERYLPEQLASLAAQERLPDELVVCDDDSHDGTVDILRSFAKDAPFPVRIFPNEHNIGPAKNFEKAASLCEGDLIALCDQDDVWYPHRLRRSAEAFAADPEIGFAFSDGDLMSEDGSPRDGRLWHSVGFAQARQEAAQRGELLRLLVLYTFVTGTTMTFRADLRDLVLPIPPGWIHDAWIALSASLVRPYALIGEPLIRYRIHETQHVGVPDRPIRDDTWGRWSARVRHAAKLGSTDISRQTRRLQAQMFEGVMERYATEGRAYLERAGRQPQPLAAETIASMEQRTEHLRVRGTLPDRRLARLPIILDEVRSGRYRRFSAGVFSGLQDLIY